MEKNSTFIIHARVVNQHELLIIFISHSKEKYKLASKVDFEARSEIVDFEARSSQSYFKQTIA
jgi:hypothetical protein